MPIEWFSWLAEVGMQKHGRLMVLNNLEEIDIAHFDHDLLRSIGVDSAKDRLLILNQKNNHMRRAKGKPIQRQHSKISVEAQASIIGRVAALHVDAVTMLVWTKKTWPLCSRKLLQDQGYLTPTASLPGTIPHIPFHFYVLRTIGISVTCKICKCKHVSTTKCLRLSLLIELYLLSVEEDHKMIISQRLHDMHVNSPM